ncbi:MAG TPA: NAD(P)-binding domain-containing protein [Terriglobales bacterium]|nr:NAD(P)-binding domain-containing protein [Terriglobales bacterium]
MKTNLSHQVAIIGAGPYGLATAAHLRAAKIETCVFGEPMEFWQNQMPEGMLLRSSWDACHIADPQCTSTLDNYSASQALPVPRPVPLDRYIDYGRWFQKRIVPDVDRRRVVGVEKAGRGFRLDLNDGDCVQVQRVIVATGIRFFARRPPQFSGLPLALVSHTSEHRNLKRFAGQRMVVIGADSRSGILQTPKELVESPFPLRNQTWKETFCSLDPKTKFLSLVPNSRRDRPQYQTTVISSDDVAATAALKGSHEQGAPA